ncbi:MAG: 4-hydroxy-tetrahydrodipicolinate reductase [Gammaproteobacteria bacterium]
MSAPIRVAVAGAAGRMGRAVIEALRNDTGLALGAAIERPATASVGSDAGLLAGGEGLGIPIRDDLRACLGAFDVLIDFSSPAATLAHVAIGAESGKRMVIGTTGIGQDGREAIAAAARRCAIMMAPNMSVGVNLCFKLLEIAARVLGPDYDVEVIEAHHGHKADAPSGTALRMGEVVAQALGYELDQCAIYARQGQTGPRPPHSIGFASVRAGDIVGEHMVMFAGPGERIELSHKASHRTVFALGALRAAHWLMRQPHGLFDMQDVLGIKSVGRP